MRKRQYTPMVGRSWSPKRVTIPEKAHPLVRRLYAEIIRQQVPVWMVADKAGVHRQTMTGWRYYRPPKLADLEAAFNVLGYKLTVTEKKESEA